jgi:hypothetical protein
MRARFRLRNDTGFREGAFTMQRAPLIAAAILTMTSCAAIAQVRVITPDSEHLYGAEAIGDRSQASTGP